jgi:sulfur carrier protein ThiS
MTSEKTIPIIIKFFADLTLYGPAKSVENVPEGSKIKSILEKYNIPTEKKLIILVNGKPHAHPDDIIKERDTIAIFPLLAGG